ncbi:hypothetical protein ACHELU_004474 [Vibrio vulnificus]
MKSSLVEILSMIGTWFSGVGAFSAVLYAINVNRPKVKAIISEIGVGEDCEFTVDVFNVKPVTAHISHVRLVEASFFSYRKIQPNVFSRSSIINNLSKRQCERLDIEVKSGDYARFEFSAKSILDAYCEFCDIRSPVGMLRMKKAKIAIFLSNGTVCYIDLPKSIYQKMKNVMMTPIHRRITELCKLGPTACYPPHYTEDHKRDLCTRSLDEYESALRRHSYLELPYGIKSKHFRSNT